MRAFWLPSLTRRPLAGALRRAHAGSGPGGLHVVPLRLAAPLAAQQRAPPPPGRGLKTIRVSPVEHTTTGPAGPPARAPRPAGVRVSRRAPRCAPPPPPARLRSASSWSWWTASRCGPPPSATTSARSTARGTWRSAAPASPPFVRSPRLAQRAQPHSRSTLAALERPARSERRGPADIVPWCIPTCCFGGCDTICCYAAARRKKLRDRYKLKGNPCTDYLMTCLCGWSACLTGCLLMARFRGRPAPGLPGIARDTRRLLGRRAQMPCHSYQEAMELGKRQGYEGAHALSAAARARVARGAGHLTQRGTRGRSAIHDDRRRSRPARDNQAAPGGEGGGDASGARGAADGQLGR